MADEVIKDQIKIKRSQWRKYIKAWEESDLSQANFCRLHNLSIKSFYYWKKKYIKAPVSIVPVNLKADIFKPSAAICLTVYDKYRIEICNGFESATLIKLLRVLES
ncbi:MAG: hypothetical protein KKC46_16105 [Proteobacteria bacterium]|nr:hypothetical protein [Pseudomonadota bacterium]